MASADPQRQQHAQGRRRASFILRGRPRGPGARAGAQAGAHRRPDRTRGPRREQSDRAGELAEPGRELEVSGGAPTPHQGRLFKFGEVGSAPSKGAWGFFINPRRSAA